MTTRTHINGGATHESNYHHFNYLSDSGYDHLVEREERNMSGGSFDYLYCKETPELMSKVDYIEEMADILARKGYCDVAIDMSRLVEYIKSAEVRITVLSGQLKDIMKAVEWYESCDIGEDGLEKAIEKYRKGENP